MPQRPLPQSPNYSELYSGNSYYGSTFNSYPSSTPLQANSQVISAPHPYMNNPLNQNPYTLPQTSNIQYSNGETQANSTTNSGGQSEAENSVGGHAGGSASLKGLFESLQLPKDRP